MQHFHHFLYIIVVIMSVLGKFLPGLKVKVNGLIEKMSIFLSASSFLCDVVVE